MIGHVYCKFTDEEDASDALQVMNDRYYDGRKMEVEFSPVQNFQEVRTQTSLNSPKKSIPQLHGRLTLALAPTIRRAVEILMKAIVLEADFAIFCTANQFPYA